MSLKEHTKDDSEMEKESEQEKIIGMASGLFVFAWKSSNERERLCRVICL
jgi:hypothetical protein